jgi:hypothetical protein
MTLDRQYAGCIILTHQVTRTTAADGFPRPSVQSVIVRVPIMVLRKTGKFSEICTKNLGNLGKEGDEFKKSDKLPLIHTFALEDNFVTFCKCAFIIF